MARYSVALKSNDFHVDYRSTVSESTGYLENKLGGMYLSDLKWKASKLTLLFRRS